MIVHLVSLYVRLHEATSLLDHRLHNLFPPLALVATLRAREGENLLVHLFACHKMLASQICILVRPFTTFTHNQGMVHAT